MELVSLRELFVKELNEARDAERQMVKALPKMAEAAATPELRNAFEMHLQQTQGHLKRVEKILKGMGEKPVRSSCKGMKGLIKENESLLNEDGDRLTLDAGMIAGAQKVEHYEIAAYGTMRTYAQRLGEPEAATLLQQTLDEEKETDRKLTELAESAVNPQAARRAS